MPYKPYYTYQINKMRFKLELKIFMNLMIEYMREHNMESDSIMKMLCDDIFIIYKTCGKSIANMYSYARQTSQGNQHSYTVSIEPAQDYDNFNIDELPPCPPPFGVRRRPSFYEADLEYTLTQTSLSPYSTQGIINVMREISGDHTIGTTQCL